MAAHPKNKITSVERGKRRAGNTPKLSKNKAHTPVPAHKKGIFAKFAKAVAGAISKPNTKHNKKKLLIKNKGVVPAAPAKVEAPKAETAAQPVEKKKTAVKKTATAKKSK